MLARSSQGSSICPILMTRGHSVVSLDDLLNYPFAVEPRSTKEDVDGIPTLIIEVWFTFFSEKLLSGPHQQW